MKKKYHEVLYDYIKTGGQGLIVQVNGRAFRFRLPLYDDVIASKDYSTSEIEKGSFLLACSLQSVGGFQVSDQHRYDLLEYFNNTPKITKRLIGYYWSCVRESHRYADFFEAFCYTTRSRSLWQEWKNASKFGFHFVAQDHPFTELQKGWVAYNEQEDKKRDLEDQWSRAFFIGSAMNPKGVMKAQKDWEARLKQDQTYRENLIKRAEEGDVEKTSVEDLRGEKSVEELQKEYWDWVEGNEDTHDQAVREYKERVQRHIEERRSLLARQEQQAKEMNEQVMALNSLSINSSPVRAYSDEEVRKLTQGREKNTIFYDEGDDYSAHISSRVLNPKMKPGAEIPTLQDQVQNRPPPKIER